MSTELTCSQLSDFLSFKNGKSSPDRDEEAPFPVFGSNGLIGHANETNSNHNTIVIGRVGSYCGSVHFSDMPCWISDNAIICTSKNPEESLFWYYLLKFSDLNQYRSGSGQPLLNQNTLNSITCKVPVAPAERIRVGKILGSFDRKREVNHQINQNLEQMAQAIFKSWFVDFEPVKAKIAALEAGGSEEDALLAAMQAISGSSLLDAGASAAGGQAALTRLQAEKPEQYAELRATAELFPSAMWDGELGEIPAGWTAVRLDQYIELAYGKALKKNARIEGQYPVYGSGGITGSHNEPLVSGPGIIIGRKGTVGSIYWEPKDFYPIDTAFYVSTKNGCSLLFAYYLLQNLGLSSMNTDAAVPGLNRNNVYRLEAPSYPEQIIKRFTEVVEAISQKMSTSNAESNSLTELRDSLLPKLLSGELSVTGTENQLAETEEPADV